MSGKWGRLGNLFEGRRMLDQYVTLEKNMVCDELAVRLWLIRGDLGGLERFLRK